jgi:hypothetical protein
MTPNDILSLVAQMGWIGLSIYGAINPAAQWIGPVATILASVTRTPQHALGGNVMKFIAIATCGSLSLYSLIA